MINTIAVSAQLGDQPDRSPSQQQDHPRREPPPEETGHPEADVRLVIEADATGQGLLYKQIDRATGEVVSTVSREALLKMGADPRYAAGAVVDTKA
jgi:hypothetical protein